MSSEGFHELIEVLAPATLDRHRAISSIMEELEAVDWYDQRVEAATDPELAAILAHNRDEEKEHAAMTIEWLRRQDPVFDRHLRTYLFTTGSITDLEHVAEHGGDASEAAAPSAPRPGPVEPDASLGIGSLRREEFSL